MNDDYVFPLDRKTLERAGVNGIDQPALLGFALLSRNSNAFHEAMCGEPIYPRSQDDGKTEPVEIKNKKSEDSATNHRLQ